MALFGLLKDSKDPAGMSGNDKLALLFSGLSDIGSIQGGGQGGAIDALTKSMTAQREKARKEKAMSDFASAIPKLLGGAESAAPAGPIMQGPGLDGAPAASPAASPAAAQPPQLQQIVKGFMPYMVNPETAPMASSMVGLLKMLQPEKPQRVEGPDGIYEIDDQGHSKLIQKYPAKERDAPSGFRWKPDGSGLELIPGYAEGQSAITGSRRDAVIARPMPGRARASGGHSGGSSAPSWLPPGAKIIHTPGH